jgi:tetratricopeptide (TPR) repeat protein
MKPDAIAMGIAGVLFGVIVGWIIGAQSAGQPGGPARAPAQSTAATTTPPSTSSARPSPRAMDDQRVGELVKRATDNPKDSVARMELGNLYFDAERYDDAIRWYEETLRIDDRNVGVSTDLGVSYYYTNQPDRALAQFEKSLTIDPNHTKTILNMGIVRAFGKQDLTGAAQAWEKVIAIAPDSAEGKAAKQALDSMKSAHLGSTQD